MSKTASGANSKEFLTGYAVGLAGGFRSWVSLICLGSGSCKVILSMTCFC
jgi:hypothetical protein